jgi:hypothetical protein
MDQAVHRRPLTAETPGNFHASACEIFGVQNGGSAGFFSE